MCGRSGGEVREREAGGSHRRRQESGAGYPALWDMCVNVPV